MRHEPIVGLSTSGNAATPSNRHTVKFGRKRGAAGGTRVARVAVMMNNETKLSLALIVMATVAMLAIAGAVPADAGHFVARAFHFVGGAF